MRKVPSRLKAGTVPVSKLDQKDRASMFAIYEKYYANVSFKEFQSDLNKKNDVLILRERSSQAIKGFSTILIMNVDLNGRRVNAIFSGDTIIEREFWGQSALHFEFAKYFILFRLKNPLTPLYWFLISKGYKTYLLLANNFLSYYPRFDRETPSEVADLISQFATRLYPDYFEADSGLIRFPYETAHLKSDVAQINGHLLATNPKVAFFARKNPQWAQGEELACVGELNWQLPLHYMIKVMRKKFKPVQQVKELDFIEPNSGTPLEKTAPQRRERDRQPDITT